MPAAEARDEVGVAAPEVGEERAVLTRAQTRRRLPSATTSLWYSTGAGPRSRCSSHVFSSYVAPKAVALYFHPMSHAGRVTSSHNCLPK